MKIPSIFKAKEVLVVNKKTPWQWPSCSYPKTLSFRVTDEADPIFKTVNSVFLDASEAGESSCCFTTSSECASATDLSRDEKENSKDSSGGGGGGDGDGVESIEMIMSEVRSSERLFFEPGETSFMIKEEGKEDSPFKGSVALALESDDPYIDFKKSMLEMVESHGLRDWDKLEELLGWYLKMNGKMNHGFIVGAFVDLLVGLATDSSSSSSSTVTPVCSSDSTSYSSADSSFSSPLSHSVAVAAAADQAQDQAQMGKISN